MAEVARRFPDDVDAAGRYAEALMDTMPWAYWEPDGSPKPATVPLIETLEKILAAAPDHPLANHPIGMSRHATIWAPPCCRRDRRKGPRPSIVRTLRSIPRTAGR
jgi:hypothetical protein